MICVHDSTLMTWFVRLQESACAAVIFQNLRMQPQQLRAVHDLWQTWRNSHRSLDSALRAACVELDTLTSAADFSRHAAPAAATQPPPPPVLLPTQHRAAQVALDPRVSPMRPSMLAPRAPRPRPPGGRRSTLPPLHRDPPAGSSTPPPTPLPAPPAPTFSSGTAPGGGGGGWNIGSLGQGPPWIAGVPPLRVLRRHISSGSSGGSGGSDQQATGFRAPDRPPSRLSAGPCVCTQCVAALTPKLLGASAVASTAAHAAERALRALQAKHLALCTNTIRAVAVPGAFFSTGQMLGAEAVALKHGVTSVDWLWIASLASMQLHGEKVLSGYDQGMFEC